MTTNLGDPLPPEGGAKWGNVPPGDDNLTKEILRKALEDCRMAALRREVELLTKLAAAWEWAAMNCSRD